MLVVERTYIYYKGLIYWAIKQILFLRHKISIYCLYNYLWPL